MNDVFVLVMLGIGLVLLEYFVDEYIFGNDKYAILFKIAIFIILIFLGVFAMVKDMVVILFLMLFLMMINKLRIVVRGT